MFDIERNEVVQELFTGNLKILSGLTGSLVGHALRPGHKPRFSPLFFQPITLHSSDSYRALSIISAPIILGIQALLLPIYALTSLIEAILNLAMLSPLKSTKNLKKSMIYIAATALVIVATITSPLINFIDYFGSTVSKDLAQTEIKTSADMLLDEEKYTCPITYEIMHEPVPIDIIDSSASLPIYRYYEYAAIKEWYDRGNKTSPQTRYPIKDPLKIGIDYAFKKEIDTYLSTKALSQIG